MAVGERWGAPSMPAGQPPSLSAAAWPQGRLTLTIHCSGCRHVWGLQPRASGAAAGAEVPAARPQPAGCTPAPAPACAPKPGRRPSPHPCQPGGCPRHNPAPVCLCWARRVRWYLAGLGSEADALHTAHWHGIVLEGGPAGGRADQASHGRHRVHRLAFLRADGGSGRRVRMRCGGGPGRAAAPSGMVHPTPRMGGALPACLPPLLAAGGAPVGHSDRPGLHHGQPGHMAAALVRPGQSAGGGGGRWWRLGRQKGGTWRQGGPRAAG